jgi:hypothetical protein
MRQNLPDTDSAIEGRRHSSPQLLDERSQLEQIAHAETRSLPIRTSDRWLCHEARPRCWQPRRVPGGHAVDDEVLTEPRHPSQHVEHLAATRVKRVGDPDYVFRVRQIWCAWRSASAT